jgi:antagonist of KipI
MEFVKVIKPGLLTTVQDLGRSAYRVYGVSKSGAMDTLSFRLANLLVGNKEGDAALEVTLIGPKLKFEADGIIAITGGNLSPKLNGEAMTMWKAVSVCKNDVLCFGENRAGCRAYISFAGGIQVPKVMGSRSTFLRGNYGGLEGRALKAGDRFPIGQPQINVKTLVGRRLKVEDTPDFKANGPIRFILGPHDYAFTAESRQKFIATPYQLSNDSDRMGFRLAGETLEHVHGADIISDFITAGTIQVPGSGLPIIHMADCGTSGGYTKMGVIIGVDLPKVAQKKPGDEILFKVVDIKHAQEKLRKQEQLIISLRLTNAMLANDSSIYREIY